MPAGAVRASSRGGDAMLFSAWPGSQSPWGDLLELVRHLEATGWDGAWLSDHFMPNEDDTTGPYAEAWVCLAALAASVPRIRLGVLVSGNTYRHPVVLAKMAAQVDIVSGGRLVLGLGAGWQENEHVAYGIPFYGVGERLRRLEEACRVIRGLFDAERTSFHGRYYRLRDAPLSPSPVQRPRPPLLIGGGGERVTLRIAARYADEWNVRGTPEEFASKVRVLERHCAAVGRDPSEIRRSAYATFAVTAGAAPLPDPSQVRHPVIAGSVDDIRSAVRRYADAGADELVVSPLGLGDAQREREQFHRFADAVERERE